MGHRSRAGGSEHLGRLSQHTVARRGSCVAVPLLGWQQGWELTPSPWSSQPGLLSRFLYCLSTGVCVSTAVWSACREGQGQTGAQCPPPVLSAAQGMAGREQGCGKASLRGSGMSVHITELPVLSVPLLALQELGVDTSSTGCVGLWGASWLTGS